MPRRPHLLPQLMRAVNDPASSGHAVATIISQDPTLATNLLRIANSALYRPHGALPVDSLDVVWPWSAPRACARSWRSR